MRADALSLAMLLATSRARKIRADFEGAKGDHRPAKDSDKSVWH